MFNLKKKKDIGERSFLMISKSAPFDYVEAYKSLRTNLNFVSLNNKYKKIIITSSIPGEGKSNLSINLAISLSEEGSKVLLIDCDLRKPVIHKFLRIKNNNQMGLTALLSGRADYGSCIMRFSDLGIDVLTSGAIPPNPTELIGGSEMEKLIEKLEKEYDYIIFDTPPCDVVTDASVLSKFVDGIIFTIRQNYASVDSIKSAQKNLENVKANIIGCVLNDFTTQKKHYTNSKYSYYSYKEQ